MLSISDHQKAYDEVRRKRLEKEAKRYKKEINESIKALELKGEQGEESALETAVLDL